MNFKALTIGTLATISTIIGVAPTAQAYQLSYECGQVRGYTACVSYQDTNSPDIVYVTGPKGKDTMSISCYAGDAYKWNSYGPNTENFMEYIAQGFCND
jgi:hypothetical protein